MRRVRTGKPPTSAAFPAGAAAGNPHAAAVERVAKETAERTGASDGKAPSKPPSTLDMLTFSDRQLEQLQKARAGAFAAAPPGSRNWSA